MDQVPTSKEWGAKTNDLDLEAARQLFFGKTREEVLPYFKRCVIERVDNLRFMPPGPFQYYMVGFRDFVTSRELIEDRSDDSWASDAASCFLGLIIEKLEKNPGHIVPILDQLMPAAEFVASHQATYDADREIYGNFGKKIRTIRRLAKKAGVSWIGKV